MGAAEKSASDQNIDEERTFAVADRKRR